MARAVSGKVGFFREAERALLGEREGPTVICVSNLLAARIRRVYPCAVARSVVIPNGVDGAHYDPEAFADAGRRWRAEHGFADAYLGLLLAHNPALKGESTVRAAMEHEKVLSLDPPFRLVVARGEVDDPRPLYAAADVFVHPTYHDPCSLACLEALAMGVPVVTTPRNGVAELMEARGGIVLEEAGCADALATALRVLADPALRAATALDARDIARRNPQTERLDEILDVCRNARTEE